MVNFVNVIYQFVLTIEHKSNEAKKGNDKRPTLFDAFQATPFLEKKKNNTPAGRITCAGNGAIPVRDYARTIHTG